MKTIEKNRIANIEVTKGIKSNSMKYVKDIISPLKARQMMRFLKTI